MHGNCFPRQRDVGVLVTLALPLQAPCSLNRTTVFLHPSPRCKRSLWCQVESAKLK